MLSTQSCCRRPECACLPRKNVSSCLNVPLPLPAEVSLSWSSSRPWEGSQGEAIAWLRLWQCHCSGTPSLLPAFQPVPVLCLCCVNFPLLSLRRVYTSSPLQQPSLPRVLLQSAPLFLPEPTSLCNSSSLTPLDVCLHAQTPRGTSS